MFGEIKKQRRIKPMNCIFSTSFVYCLRATDMEISANNNGEVKLSHESQLW